MADHVHPLEELFREVQEMMTAEAVGPTVTHFFGAKGKATHGRPPRYVWVPTRIAERGETPTRNVEEFRTIFAWAEHCEVYVWGRCYRPTSSMSHRAGCVMAITGMEPGCHAV